jgi:hypothetical protein
MSHLIEQTRQMGWLWTGVFECISEWVDVLKIFFNVYYQDTSRAFSSYSNSCGQGSTYIIFLCILCMMCITRTHVRLEHVWGCCSSGIWCYVTGWSVQKELTSDMVLYHRRTETSATSVQKSKISRGSYLSIQHSAPSISRRAGYIWWDVVWMLCQWRSLCTFMF